MSKVRNTMPEYHAWKSMLARCHNENHEAYQNYGGRGITVCEEFRDFNKFYAHVGPRPSPEHSLERINNSRGYEIGNITWDTRITQANNRRSTLIVDYLGNAMSLRAAVRSAGDVVAYPTAHQRIKKGWPTYEAITIPATKHGSKCPKIDLGYPLG